MNKAEIESAYQEIERVFTEKQSFVLMSHVRPDGDAIGSILGLGLALEAAGKTVYFLNEDGVPESLAFLRESNRVIQSPSEPINAEVAIALDTAVKSRLGKKTLAATEHIPLWINIDHHISNPCYGKINLVDANQPATGQIVYQLIKCFDLPLPAASRDAIYVAVSTDTGSFQYRSTSAETYDMAADLVRQGLDVGEINALTYDSHSLRRIQLLRVLLNSLEISNDGKVAHWAVDLVTKQSLDILNDDSEGLIDMIRGIRGVQVAAFFEELENSEIRVSLRSKSIENDVCEVATEFGGGGHKLAAGIRISGEIGKIRQTIVSRLEQVVKITD